MSIDQIKMAESAVLKFSQLIHFKEDEWTCFSAVLDDEYNVIAMGTGLKCLPECKLIQNNVPLPYYYDVVRDMHAEIICRRAFIRFLLLNPEKVDANYHFYTTKVPCGDASMKEEVGESWKLTFSNQVGRGREDWSKRGIVRTKPGRGDAPSTKCVSCSDKMALWNVIGVQGAFLPQKVIFKSIIIDNCEAQLSKCVNSLKLRVGLDSNCMPELFLVDSKLFKHRNESLTKCSISHAWHLGMSNVEVLADGRKLGASGPKGGQLHMKSVSLIATSSLYRLISKQRSFDILELKKKDIVYQSEKAALISKYLKEWPRAMDKYSLTCHNANCESPNADGRNGQFP